MFADMPGSKLAGGTNARDILCDKACRIGDCADIPQTMSPIDLEIQEIRNCNASLTPYPISRSHLC